MFSLVLESMQVCLRRERIGEITDAQGLEQLSRDGAISFPLQGNFEFEKTTAVVANEDGKGATRRERIEIVRGSRDVNTEWRGSGGGGRGGG